MARGFAMCAGGGERSVVVRLNWRFSVPISRFLAFVLRVFQANFASAALFGCALTVLAFP
ncbi:hypothetical protein [Paraburkholderia domus]|uniref:hypothetical protein n=1 Tax=Paraburkholderia domus TaxID=2793075 RepID=UPI0019123C4F|nr:hypothetical protein [Paraburkholderia domus]MBK5054304.1 hypothetical protein [Burkholderia sp. R-70006]MBK5064511.1 hypothetical protein [Burkholderia sp. R-70199]MBK5091325.1 hypothetical protein [Burkholderia sp. R-69927]MBK5125589.1 hypothetical protein [Burkholderia sp. R-69980]MBK5168483.1 hypothetical protein [Burkholderia sp. R-70211]MBK5183700.1 hypothetical protein [Burkholderia sp. R-69749]MCI0149208.1 hypothetical protein [Paraburkholderia sediminicola]